MLAYGISALFSLQAFVKFAQTLFDPAVKGDLMLRAHEFMHFMAGRDPASASTELGYPIWAYITGFIWFGPLGIESASWLYPLLCLIVLAAIFALLFNLLPGDLGAARKAIIITGSMPGFALAEQARFLNYGIVVMGGLCLFVFGKSSLGHLEKLGFTGNRTTLKMPPQKRHMMHRLTLSSFGSEKK
jgi:hypothetical protein